MPDTPSISAPDDLLPPAEQALPETPAPAAAARPATPPASPRSRHVAAQGSRSGYPCGVPAVAARVAQAEAQGGAQGAAQAGASLSPAACAALLAQHFPALFGAGRVLPVKLRIQADIQSRVPGVFSKKALSIFLHRYTTSTAYLKALAGNAQRFDLDGAAAGELADEHRQAALLEIERRRSLVEDRRAVEREAQQAQAAQRRREAAAQAAARNAAHHAADNEARRGRAALLRAFETATLTKANFCALKGLVEADLDAQLSLARQEREQRPVEAPQRPQRRDAPGRPDRPQPRGDGQGRGAAGRPRAAGPGGRGKPPQNAPR